jgi:hypothetical protein
MATYGSRLSKYIFGLRSTLATHLFKSFLPFLLRLLDHRSRTRSFASLVTGYATGLLLPLSPVLDHLTPHLLSGRRSGLFFSLFARILAPPWILRKRIRLAIILHDRFSSALLGFMFLCLFLASRSRHRIVYGFLGGTYSEIGNPRRSCPFDHSVTQQCFLFWPLSLCDFGIQLYDSILLRASPSPQYWLEAPCTG